MKRVRSVALGAAAITALGGFIPSVASATTPGAPKVTVIATGLNNPRGVAYSGGTLYVTQAGSGGSDCPSGYTGPDGGQLCVGRSGALTAFSGTPIGSKKADILTGVISESDIPGGLAGQGIMDVVPTSTGVRALYTESVVGTLAGLPSGTSFNAADSAAIRHLFGKATAITAGGTNAVLADVGDADYSWAAVHQSKVPGQFPDANPNAMIVVANTTYVADAGSNTVDSVTNGVVKQLAFLPNSSASDAAPTCVAMGPLHQDLYVGELAPFAGPGKGSIYKLDLATGRLTVWKTGFGAVDGCGFDSAGNFYATEFQHAGFNPGPAGFGSGAGDVVKITPTGTRTLLGVGALSFPQGFATDGKGGIFVSDNSILPAYTGGGPTGEVVRIGP